jgi:hypothetical protein
VVVETEALDEARRATLLNLVAASDFFRLPATLATAQSGPDRFQYKLEIQHGSGRTHSVKFGGESAPASLLELTQALRQTKRG